MTLILIQHDGHGLDQPTTRQAVQPDPTTLVHMITAFFARTLAPHEKQPPSLSPHKVENALFGS
ncbi:hypothetical protein [Dictyobacter kobayashii]|uniref:hypothetical protein n=1 Tax=Dictyobacter kobayashii TaxID=2014872 RepID=UPI000F83477E|nr:hypothetical protein [Dictyobacter kobayashii]